MPASATESDHVLRVERDEGFAVVTLDRPAARNALNARLRAELYATMSQLDEDDAVAAVVLTGADPAFCAGLDLKELASAPETLAGGFDDAASLRRPYPEMSTPVIGAINGVAITGGFELALACDFLVASEHARFADTHARVGIMPGWGLTVLLPQAVGLRRARELSSTGNFLDAATAYDWGLVNHVVAHDRLLPFARKLAADIAGNDHEGVRQILATYREGSLVTGAEAFEVELRHSRAWLADRSGEDLEARRQAVTERGRSQV
jgi:enoyl-CoA hydratase/carnithine racemase